VISEETGFLGAFLLIVLYGCLLFSVFRTALLAPDLFGRYLCTGIGTVIAVHTVVNMGMSIRLVPITGLPLPLVSYGGTFLVTVMVYLGIVQSIYAHRTRETFLTTSE
jgi:rod shape determining protein RodA